MTDDTITAAIAVCDAASQGPAVWAADDEDKANTRRATERLLAHFNKAYEVTGSAVLHQVDLPDQRTEADGTALCFAVTGNGPKSAANARFIASALDPEHGWKAALREIRNLRCLVVMLYQELAEHYPVSITARAMCADEAKEADLREVIDVIGNGGDEVRRAHLPERIRAAVDGTAISAYDAQEIRIKVLRAEVQDYRAQLETTTRDAARVIELDHELERLNGSLGDIVGAIERRGGRDVGTLELVTEALRTELVNIQTARERPPDWIRVGAVVDYHARIGGPVTSAGMLVRGGPERLASGEWVVWLKGKSGAVSVRACSPTEASGG